MIDNDVVVRIARKIRATRLKKNLTVQQLAARTQVSKGLLSKIENSRTVPSLPVFIALVQSLDISFREFFQDLVSGREYIHVKKGQSLPLQEIHKGIKHQFILSRNVPNCTMEAALVAVKPGAKISATIAEGYKFIYVLSGRCEYYINKETVVLEEGDSLYLDAAIPHVPVNKTSKEVHMLVICFNLPMK